MDRGCRVAKDTVDWRAQFMAHVGQESCFGSIGSFGVLFSLPQLDLIFLQFSRP
jgi:hypothetical protein